MRIHTLFAMFGAALLFTGCEVTNPITAEIATRPGSGNPLRLTKKDEQRIVEEVLASANAHRASVGKGPLTRHPELDAIAREHSISMLQARHVSHDGWNERELGIRKILKTKHIGENVGGGDIPFLGSDPARHMIQMWVDDPPHRKTLEAGVYNTTGIGVVIENGDIYLTQLYSSKPRG